MAKLKGIFSSQCLKIIALVVVLNGSKKDIFDIICSFNISFIN